MNETLSSHVEFKFDAGDVGTFTGYASTFNGPPDSAGDIVMPGAFARTLADHKAAGASIPLLWSHDAGEPIGVIEEAQEDRRGLYVRGRLILDVARAREAHALARAGAAKGLSIGFRTRSAERGPGGARRLVDVELVEISLVTRPADKRAGITDMKGERHMAEEMTVAAETPPNEDPRLTALETKLDALSAEVTKHKSRADALELKVNRGGVVATKEDTAAIEAKAFAGFVRRGRESLQADEVKTLRVSEDTAGGFLAPAQFLTELDRNLVLFSPIRAAARVSGTTTGSVILPRRTGAITASWTGETTARPETQPAYGQIEFPVHELACYVDVSNRMLEDSAIDIAAELAFDFAEEFGRAEGRAFIVGDSIRQPLGLLNTTLTTVKTGNATGFVAPSASVSPADCIKDLVFALAGAYAANAVFGMNRTTMGMVAKFKDAQGQYIWQDPLSAGQPATIMGRPVVEMPDMPDVAANATPIVFGDFRHFRIYDRVALSVLRDPYSQATNGQTRFHARRRVGGGVARPEAFRLLKVEA